MTGRGVCVCVEEKKVREKTKEAKIVIIKI
jgi:hypothetical protein